MPLVYARVSVVARSKLSAPSIRSSYQRRILEQVNVMMKYMIIVMV